MVFLNWYKWVVLKNYANFEGRASFNEYWLYVVDNIIISIIFSILMQISYTFGYVLYGLYSLAVLIPGLALSVRRLHDIGKSGWSILIGLIPIVGLIILIVWFIQKGNPVANEYGEVPIQTPPEE